MPDVALVVEVELQLLGPVAQCRLRGHGAVPGALVGAMEAGGIEA